MDAAEHSHATHFAQAQPQEGSCCCNEEQCSLPAKPDCCACCPSAPLDPAAVANAKLHAEAAYTGLNRTDPDAIWYYQGWILGGQFSFIKGLTEAVKLEEFGPRRDLEIDPRPGNPIRKSLRESLRGGPEESW